MKKKSIFLLIICLIYNVSMILASATSADFNDTFDSNIEISATNGWTLENANNGTAGTIVAEEYIVDASKQALTFASSGNADKNLAAYRVFPSRKENFVIDFEVAFKEKGAANLLYAYQGSQYLFTISADANKIVGYVGTGNYDNTATNITYLSSYEVNKAYHFQIAVNTEIQTFNAYINGEFVLKNIPLRNKITTGMTKAQLFQTGDSKACWQLVNFGIHASAGVASVSGVSIDQTPYLGNTIAVNYAYSGNADDDFSIVKWLYSDSEFGEYEYISDATGKSFSITPFFAGKWIKAEVTPYNGLFATDLPVYSEPVLDMTDTTILINETNSYTTKNNAEWDSLSSILTLTTKDSLGAEATVNTTENITGTIVLESSIKNKNKDAASALNVFQDSSYVFNITFSKSDVILYCGTEPGSGYKSQKLVANYVADTWYEIKVIINSTTSTADFYVNEKLVYDDVYLRTNLSKGITKVSSSRTNLTDGQTYIKGLKLYGLSTPIITSTSACIKDIVMYTGFSKGTGCARLDAELLDQFGEKIEDNGFTWSLVKEIDGVRLTSDGILMINKAISENIMIKATSNDDENIVVYTYLESFGDFNDKFDSELLKSTTDGWTLNTADEKAGNISADNYVLDSSRKALTFKPSGTKNLILRAERAFPARTGTFVIDFELTFKEKGAANFLYAYQDSALLFAITADDTRIGAWVGTGAYDNTATFKTLLASYDTNTAYHFQVVVNSDMQVFNVYLNESIILANIPLRNKITSGMTRASIFQPSDSEAEFQFLNFGIQTPAGNPSVSNVSIDETPFLGNTITVEYTYSGDDEDDFSIVKWMCSDSENGEYEYIPGATGKSFLVTPSTIGKWIKAEVTPCNGLFATGTPVCSAPVIDMTDKNVVFDENTTYALNNTGAKWNPSSATLTLTSNGTTAGVATITSTNNVTGTAIFEAKIKNKTKSVSPLMYVYQGSNYVFNITFDAHNMNLYHSSIAGQNNYISKVIVKDYVADAWYDIKAIINTETNTADFYVNDALAIEGAGLRTDLTTIGINKITFTGTTSSGGETYVKDLKLYLVEKPVLKPTSICINEPIIRNENGVVYVNLDADLLDQYGGKIENTGFNWELISQNEGVNITSDGVLEIVQANIEYVVVKAISIDDENIVAQKRIRVQKRCEITNFGIFENDNQQIITFDKDITATASADVVCNFGSNDITIAIAFYSAIGKLMYVSTEKKIVEYKVSTPMSVSLTVDYTDKTAGGYFKAFIVDSEKNIKPLAESISTKF